MEAINSEESEEDLANHPLKTIYDWRRDTVHNGNIEISRKSNSNSAANLRNNSDKISRKFMK